ncbi:MAG: DUF2905 domain-containing protein [Chloroflexota bacterium]
MELCTPVSRRATPEYRRVARQAAVHCKVVEGFSFYFPLASSILVSVVVTILLNVIVRLMKK